jgi:cellobiose phosphorylase
MWHSYVAYILGIRPQLDGLLIDPHVPGKWSGFRVKRPFRGAVYQIEVRNPKSLTQGVHSVTVDGRREQGNLIRAHSDGREHAINVILEG